MKCKTCRFIEHGIYFKLLDNGYLTIKHCANMDAFPENVQPHLQDIYDGTNIDWDEIFKRKRADRDKFRQGSYYSPCTNCWELKEQEIDDDDYISHLTLAHITKCNSRCVYCIFGQNEKHHSAEQKYDLFPLICEMKEKGILRFNGSLRYMGGEPTLMKEFEEITNLFVDNNVSEIYLPTSGIKLSKAVVNACQTIPICKIHISIDSGSPETYKKIKGVDAYNLVLNSLKKYVENKIVKEDIHSKYIILPDYNDNTEEIDKWISDSKNIGLECLCLDVEFTYINDDKKEKYRKHLLQLWDYTQRKVVEQNIAIDPCVPYLQSLLRWKDNNKKKLKNDTSKEIVEIDVSRSDVSQIKNEIDLILDKSSIWKKPAIKFTSDDEITEQASFEPVLFYCIQLGFDVIVYTNAEKLSKNIIEALKTSNIKLYIPRKAKYTQEYLKYSKSKVRFLKGKNIFDKIKQLIWG